MHDVNRFVQTRSVYGGRYNIYLIFKDKHVIDNHLLLPLPTQLNAGDNNIKEKTYF